MLKSTVNTVGLIARVSKGFKFNKKIEKQIRTLVSNSININTKKITVKGQKEFTKIFNHSKEMVRHGRNSTPVIVLKYADDLSELPFYARASKIFGKQIDGLLTAIPAQIIFSLFSRRKNYQT